MQATTLFLLFAFTAALCFVVIEVRLIARERRARMTKMVTKEWGRVCRMIEQNPKNAVIEADKLLEFALAMPKKRNFQRRSRKTSLGENLKMRGESLFSDVDSVWRVHKLRNRIVHEIGFEITAKDARDALKIFRNALAELGVKFPRNANLV